MNHMRHNSHYYHLYNKPEVATKSGDGGCGSVVVPWPPRWHPVTGAL